MPAIMVEAGPLTKEQKAALGKRMTEVASDIMGVPEEAFLVFMKENPLDNITVGGTLVSEIKKQQEQKK